MSDYQIQPNSRHVRRPAVNSRPVRRYSASSWTEGGKLVRRDFAADSWQGPPAEAFSFWAGRVVGAGLEEAAADRR